MGTTTRLIWNNWMNSSAASVVASSEDVLAPAMNLVNRDRYVSFYTGYTTVSPMLINVDLGAPRAVDYLGIINFVNRYDPPTGTGPWPASWKVGYQTTPGFGAITFIGTSQSIQYQRGDFGFPISRITARYWQFYFTPNVSPGFSLGNLLIGNLGVDLGMVYSPGATETTQMNRIRTRSIGGQPTISQPGPSRRFLVLPFNAINAATLASLKSAIASPTFFYIDHTDKVQEVTLASDKFERTHRWNSPALYDATLELEVLP